MTLEDRVSILEKNFNALLKRTDNDNQFNKWDKDAMMQTGNNQGVAINENDSAICDVAELSDVNSQAIDDLAEVVDELSNKIAEMEG